MQKTLYCGAAEKGRDVYVTIIEQARAMQNYIAEFHHDIHMHPELGFQEFRTMERLLGEIEPLGLPVKRYDPTGFHVDIKGNLPDNGLIVGLRSDLDALPVTETPNAKYRSVTEGVMHACGHDANQSMLLGALKILASRRNGFAGTVRCLFQPAEELGRGGKLVMEQGACDGVSMYFGMHVAAETPNCAIGYNPGRMGAAVSEFHIRLTGKGAPGSQPERGVDAGVAACEICAALQTIVSRRVNPQDPAVLTISYIKAGESNVNFIPARAEIIGNCRWFSKELTEKLPVWIREIVAGLCQTYGVTFEIDYDFRIAPLECDPKAVDIAMQSVHEVLGADAKTFVFGPIMASEDFSWLAHTVPSAYLEIGCGLDSGMTHSNEFHSSDECLPYGAAIFATEALKALKYLASQQEGGASE